MSDLLLLALGASLVNNFVLTSFLGLCPFVGVSRRFEAAAGMALATLFVLTLASGLSYVAWHWLLEPLGLGWFVVPSSRDPTGYAVHVEFGQVVLNLVV